MNTEHRDRTHPLLYVIVGLLVLNLAVTGWLASRGTQEDAQAVATSELPDALDQNELKRLIKSFLEPYNSGDLQATYDVLHPLAKVQLQPDHTQEIIAGLRTSFGDIKEAIYSHFIYGGYSGGRYSYDLVYKVRYGGGALGDTSGSLTMTIFYDGGEIGVTGFNLGQS